MKISATKTRIERQLDTAMILRLLLVSYLCNLSDRQTEEYINENLAAKCFVGLAVDQKALITPH